MNGIPTITKNLLAINVLMFLALFVAERHGIDLNAILGLHLFISEDFQPYQLVTYMFMHGSITHLFFNMFALYMFGRTLEYMWGPKRFLVYYLLAGIGAALVQEAVCIARYNAMVSNMTPQDVELVLIYGLDALHQGKNFIDPSLGTLNLVLNSTTVGASGAIYGILLAFGVFFPNNPIYIMFIPYPIKAKWVIVGYAAIELMLGMGHANTGIAHFAHLGGMIFGFLMILYWKKTGTIRKNDNYY